MRPTHVSIVGRSRAYFVREVAPRPAFSKLAHIAKRIDVSGNIELHSTVRDENDLSPLLSFLRSHGISLDDVRVRYPEPRFQDILNQKLMIGLEASGLNFGGDVAEHDEGLTRYFISTHSYAAIKSGQRHLVIGPKGSGKSAMLRVLAAQLDDHLIT